jgi:FlaA1/EpsC-like NDP-sugar epimerase
MVNFFNKYLSSWFLPRWLVLVFDLFVVTVAFQFAYLVRFGFDYGRVESHITINQTIFVVGLYLILFLITKSFSGIIRHSGVDDAIKIITASIISGFVILLASISFLEHDDGILSDFIPKGVIIIHSLLVLLVLMLSRIAVRGVYLLAKGGNDTSVAVVIYGAGSAGVITNDTLFRDRKVDYIVKCFIDDNKRLQGKYLYGKKIEAPCHVLTDKYVRKHKIDEIILAIEEISSEKKNEIVDKCLEIGVKVRIIPPIDKWVNGELSSTQIKEVNIEDLLDRKAIVLDDKNTLKEVRGKIVLVTGAAGSIGSEIVRQLITKYPVKLILFEQAESPLHDLRIEIGAGLLKKYPAVDVEFVIGDIRNKEFVKGIFNKFRPSIVYHAAAYKHVPLMEEYPSQAVNTNIRGTKNIADASVEYGVKKFVMVSTDKAVNPTNVMGASKRIAEIYIQSLSKTQTETKFITTRFGNVLGSNGSVIPMFKKQIDAGGPLTVTHQDITRYFMTIPEACQLVLEAGAMGNGGEIFIFDMGKSVKIVDVAKKMIQLSGLEYPGDIDIVYTGLRPGEKLYEELLASKEGTVPTHHPKIMIANIRDIDHEEANKSISKLTSLIGADPMVLVAKMKEIVPEFVSNNSLYEELDVKK